MAGLHHRRRARCPETSWQACGGPALRDLFRLHRRSLPPWGLNHVLRTPVITARGLAEHLAISPQAALGLLRQLLAAAVIREATDRAAWRALTTT